MCKLWRSWTFFCFQYYFYSNFVEKIPWVDHKTKTESFKKTGPCQEKHRGFPKSSFSPPPQKTSTPMVAFCAQKNGNPSNPQTWPNLPKRPQRALRTGLFFFLLFFWLARLVGNEGPSTFTGWYIGDETSRKFPTKGQLVFLLDFFFWKLGNWAETSLASWKKWRW